MTKREMRKQIADLTERLTKLENMHARIEEVDDFPWGFTPMAIKERTYCHKIGSYDNRPLTAREVQSIICNPLKPSHIVKIFGCRLEYFTMQIK